MIYALIDYSAKQRFNQISSEEILGEVKITTPKIKEKNQKRVVKKLIRKIDSHKVENVLLSKELISNANLCHALEESKKYIVTGRRMGKALLNKFITEISKYTKYSKEKIELFIYFF